MKEKSPIHKDRVLIFFSNRYDLVARLLKCIVIHNVNQKLGIW